jgi:TPR repeat protein
LMGAIGATALLSASVSAGGAEMHQLAEKPAAGPDADPGRIGGSGPSGPRKIDTKDPPAHECDRLAAHPYDPNKKADGVFLWKIDRKAALLVCARAAKNYPDATRFHAQYGRVLLRNQRYREALAQFKSAAGKNHPVAHMGLATMRMHAFGVHRDFADAMKGLHRAKDGGMEQAVVYIEILRKQSGGEAGWDRKRALENLRKWAERGVPDAQLYLAVSYYVGNDVKKDVELSLVWARRAAAQDMPEAVLFIAWAHRHGVGVPRDMKRAIELYRRAAELGEVEASYWLGDAYITGSGVAKDPARGRALIKTAAQLDMVRAQYRFGELLEKGIGGPVNKPEAYFWYAVAAREGQSGSKKARERLGATLTAEVRRAADARAQKWRVDF